LVVGREGCAAEACKGGEGFNKVYRAAFIEWRTQLAKDRHTALRVRPSATAGGLAHRRSSFVHLRGN
jgi:hypothetical protein